MLTLNLIDSKISIKYKFKVILKYTILHKNIVFFFCKCNYFHLHNEYTREFVMKIRQI